MGDETAKLSLDGNFEIEQDIEAGVPVLTVTGEVDVSTAPELREHLMRLADEGHRLVVVDLTEVSFVDSTALGVLVSGVTRLRNDGGDLRLVVTQPHISKVLEITGLIDVFAIFETLAEAVRE